MTDTDTAYLDGLRHRERREKIAMHLLAAQMANPAEEAYGRTLVEYAVTVADMLIDEVDRKPIPKRER